MRDKAPNPIAFGDTSIPRIRVTRLEDGFKKIQLFQRTKDNKVNELCFTVKGKLAQLEDAELTNVLTQAFVNGLLTGKLKIQAEG